MGHSTPKFYLHGLIFAFLVTAINAQSCSTPLYRGDQPSEDLGIALQRIACPFNTGYTQLYSFQNTSSVPDSNRDIIAAFEAATPYLEETTPMSSESGSIYWNASLEDIEFECRQWVARLVLLKKQLFDSGIGSTLPDALTQQKEGLKTFMTTFLTKVYETLRKGAEDTINPIYGYFDCAVEAFSAADSQVTECALLPTVTSSTAAPTNAAPGPDRIVISAVPVVAGMVIAYGNGLL